jgi:hypothetical protein
MTPIPTKSTNSVENSPDERTVRQVGEPWTDKFGRQRVPAQTFVGDDDREHHGEQAMLRGDAWVAGIEEHNREFVERLTSKQRAEFEHYMRTRERRRAQAATAKQRTPATRPRERRDSGSRRASGRRAGQDPGDDDPEPDPWDLGPPPPRIPGQIPLFMGGAWWGWRR